MHINKLHLKNFRCFERLEIDLHDRMTVIVGGNGTGKTSVMESLAIAAGTFFLGLDTVKSTPIKATDARYSYHKLGSNLDSQQNFPVEITAQGELGGAFISWKRSLTSPGGKTTYGEASELIRAARLCQKRVTEGDRELILPLIAYYGTGRLWDYHREKQADGTKKSSRTNGYTDCLDGTANIKLMLKWFQKMTLQKYQRMERGEGIIPEFEAVCNAMARCLALASGYGDVKIQYNLDIKEIEVQYVDTEGNSVRIPLNQMSDGYKGTVSLVADIAYRMAILNPQLLSEIPEKTSGVVIIDEIDLHLHPEWQQHILNDLCTIFPKVQFIVSTHAPAVINTVPGECLRVLKENRVHNAPDETYGKDVNTIVREIMSSHERHRKSSCFSRRFTALWMTATRSSQKSRSTSWKPSSAPMIPS